MNKIKILLTGLALATALAACQDADAPAPPAAPVARIAVTPQGQEIKPPAPKEAIPPGAWYCDMGTVHYARGEKGDGKCPLCHMPLTQKHDH
jgi:hypothetical protein